MKKKDVTIALADTVRELKDSVFDTVAELTKDYIATADSNSAINHEVEMHERLIRHEILSSLHSYTKKEFDTSKKELDARLTDMGYDVEGSPGITRTVYQDAEITFNKRQNKDGVTTGMTDLLNALSQIGVPKETINKAVEQATKPKRGNVYYIIEVGD